MKINLVHDMHDREEPLEALPASPEEAPRAIETVWGLFEVLLKAPDRLNPFVRTPGLQNKLCLGFSAIVVVGLALAALGLFAALRFAPAEAIPGILKKGWDGGLGGLVGLLAAYPVGVLAASLLALPSYWFVTLLAGVKMPLKEVLTHSLKGKAASTVLIVGLMPVWGVLVACLILVGVPAMVIEPLLWVGLLLPYLAGLRGAGAIQSGFQSVVAGPGRMSRESRESVSGWLMLSWAFLFTLIAPVVMLKAYEIATRLLSAA
jgi:hypothetical protein